MSDMKRSNVLYWLALITCMLAVAGLAVTAARVFGGKKAGSIGGADALAELADTIHSHYYYYDEKGLSDEALVESAMRGMVGALDDPYAEYLTEAQYAEMQKENAGDYVGLGISVLAPDDVGSTVVSVYTGGPADLAGIRAGDVLTAVNGAKTAGLTMDELLNCFSTDDTVADEITYLRGGAETTVTVLRAAVHINRVISSVPRDSVGCIRITEFNGSVAEDFWSAAQALKEQGVDRLIIDLRNNPGGGLTEVLAVADYLIPEGKTIVTIKSRSEGEDVYESKGSERLDMRLAVLVNGDSASASELLAGALQDYGFAVVVGTQTYGKGIVQSFYRLQTNGGWVKFTTDTYYTPNNVCIQGVGITPDIVVELPEELRGTSIELLDPAQDTQLQAAISALLDSATAKRAVNW